MESDDVFKKLANSDEMCQFSVALVGFDSHFVERIKNIFKSGLQSKRTYNVVASDTNSKIDVLLVNHDNPVSASKKENLLNTVCPQAVVVVLSQGPLLNPPPYHIRGMLTAARLLGVLDKLPLQTFAKQALDLQTIPPSPFGQPAVLTPAVDDKRDNTPPVSASTARVFTTSSITPREDVATIPASTSATPIVVPPSVATASDTPNYRALIVDDSLAIRMSIKLKLESVPQITSIDFADTGESALEKCAMTVYDLIFLDVMMPGIDGYETCSRLRRRPEYKKTPIIMVSGKTSPLDEVKGVMAGCTTYLTKPVQDQAFHKLSLRVLNWLADRKAVAING